MTGHPSTRAIAWVPTSLALSQVLRLIQAILVARWLGPEDMGLYAYVFSILTLVELLRAIGAEQVYIARSPDDSEAERIWLTGCWNSRLLLSLLVAAMMLIIGLSLSSLFGEQRLGTLLMLLAPISPLASLRSARLLHFQKIRDFAPLSKFEIGAAALQASLPVAAAYYFRSVEMLVIANVVAALLVATVSHLIFRMEFGFRFPRELLDELIFFGKNNIAIGMLTTIHTNLDNIAIGTFIGRASLGIYSTGYRLAMAPHGFIKPVADRILTPTYRIAHSRSMRELVDQWQIGFSALALVYGVGLGAFVLLSDLGVDLLFGDKWEGMAHIIVFTCLMAFFRGMAVTISPLLTILRAPNVDARFKGVEVALFILFVVAGSVTREINYFLWGGVASYFVAFALRWAWWNHRGAAQGIRVTRSREYIYAAMGFAILGLATTLHYWDIELVTAIVTLFATAAVPASIASRELIKRFNKVAQ